MTGKENQMNKQYILHEIYFCSTPVVSTKISDYICISNSIDRLMEYADKLIESKYSNVSWGDWISNCTTEPNTTDMILIHRNSISNDTGVNLVLAISIINSI